MSNPGQSIVVLVTDDGRRFSPGAPIRIVRTPGHVALELDPRGDYEVYSWEPEVGISSEPLLKVILRKV
jgi:hypothetical protein